MLTLVEQFGRGGGPDRLARALAPLLAAQLGCEVRVKNVSPAGAGAAGAAAAGGVVLVDTAAFASRPLFTPRVAAAHAALEPLVAVCAQPYVLVAAAGSPHETVLAPDEPGAPLRYAVPELGSATHVLLARLYRAIARTAQPVPAPPSEAPIASTLALVEQGEASVALAPIPFAEQWCKRGLLAPVAVTTARRSRRLPDVRTIAELSGVAFDAPVWYGLWSAASVSAHERPALAAAISRVLYEPELTAFLEEEDCDLLGLDGAGLAGLVAAERSVAQSLLEP